MNRDIEPRLPDDEFEPIELGSVSKETLGSIFAGDEGNVLPNTKEDI